VAVKDIVLVPGEPFEGGLARGYERIFAIWHLIRPTVGSTCSRPVWIFMHRSLARRMRAHAADRVEQRWYGSRTWPCHVVSLHP